MLPGTVRTFTALLTAALAAVLLAACGGGSGSTDTSTISALSTATTPAPAATTTPAPTATTGGCKKATPADAKGRTEPKPTKADALPAGKTATVTLTTSCGTITIQLDQKAQPKTASNFAYLVKKGFYDGLTFHRVIQTFVIQGGDPNGDGEGGPGYTVVEKPPADAQYTHGVVAMAKTGSDPPGASGSQFFIVTAPDAGLPPDYAIAGKVTGGDQAVTTIAGVPTDPSNDQPTAPVVIEKATLKVQ
jgi:cyclophilin family peptidyl-prolyl cis-trans isomerase